MNFKYHLRQKIKGYLERPVGSRSHLKKTLDEIAVVLPETVIFGGMIREFAIGNARQFTSDIDLVTLAPRAELGKALQFYEPTLNKFGGFRFVVNKQRFDIWSLSDTWAYKQGYVKGEKFEDLFKTTFFNIDAAIFHLSTEQLDLHDGYENWIRERLLDVNLAPNPRPANMIRRVISLIQSQRMGIAHKLAKYVDENHSLSAWTPIEERLFSQVSRYIESGDKEVLRINFQPELII